MEPSDDDVVVPAGFTVRERFDSDVEAVVDLTNRHAPTTDAETAVGFRRWRALNPMPYEIALVVFDSNGSLVAHAAASDGGMWAQPDMSWQGKIVVDRAVRRRGIGRALAGALEHHARSQGASKLKAKVREDEADAIAFAAALGYGEYHRRYLSILDVSAFDPARFDPPDEVATKAGVVLRTFGEVLKRHAGDEETYLRLIYEADCKYMLDVPVPTPFVPPSFESARKMTFETPTLDRDASILVTRDRRFLGLTITDVNESGVGFTFMTGVDRELRGKGLAFAMKLRAILALKARGVKWFGTVNDEANAAMRGINQRLGYVAQPAQIQVQKVFS